MIKNDRTKLELIRLEGIRYLITNKIPKNELDEIIKEELKIESKDCFELLKKLNRYQLIKIIEYSNKINSDDIDSSYEQFRYGLKPGFTIFSFISSSTKIIDTKSATSFINERLNEIKYFEDSKFKNLKLKDIDPIYFEKSYVLNIDKPQKAYTLFKNALKKSGKVALAKTVISSKFYYVVLRFGENQIIMTTLYFQEEVNLTESVDDAKTTEKEMDLATKILNFLEKGYYIYLTNR